MSIKSSVLIVSPWRLSLQYLMNSGEGALGSETAGVRGLVVMGRVEDEELTTRLAGEGEAGVAEVVAGLVPTTDQALPVEAGAVPPTLAVRGVLPRAGRVARGEAAAEP